MNNNKEKSAGFVSKLRKIETIAETLLSSKTPYSPKKQCRFVCKKSHLWKGRKILFFAAKIPRKWWSCFRLRRAEKQSPRKDKNRCDKEEFREEFGSFYLHTKSHAIFGLPTLRIVGRCFFSSFGLFVFSSVLMVFDDFSLCRCSFSPFVSIPAA